MTRLVLLTLIFALIAGAAAAGEGFKDVPKDHWAAESVQVLADSGIVQGFPDGTFRGDQPLTRYEFAVALERFVAFIQQSQKPLVPESKESDTTHSGLSQATPASPPAPATAPAKDAAKGLKDQGFLPKDSPVLKDPRKPVTAAEMADALASVAKRLIELRVPREDQNSSSF